MALKINKQNDWGEMFDKFATVPDVKAKAVKSDSEEDAQKAKKAADDKKKK